MSSRSVRWLFIGVLVLLPAQYALVGVIGHYHSEPWPALVLPAFQTTWEQGQPIRVERIVLEVTFEEGGQSSIPVESLLAPLPHSQHRGFFRAQCQPARLSGTPRTERCLHPDAASWLRQQTAGLFPGRSPTRLDVIWNHLTYMPTRRLTAPHAAVSTTPLDTLTITW